ncbi:MAG: hypothetical protein FJ098_08405 [Deltaproteobacteria bacterium]|nr:hypothetical protein [Deltaproteobacteria bacterium]
MDLSDRIERTRHFGAEFLTWLLVRSSRGEGTVPTAGGPVEVWFMDKIRLASPLASKEVDLFRGQTPAHSHEALEALRRGKVVEEAVLTVSRGDDREWKLCFHGPRFALSSVRLPALLKEESDERVIERFWLLEQLHKIMEDLYTAFLEIHLDPQLWGRELSVIRAWLAEEPGV